MDEADQLPAKTIRVDGLEERTRADKFLATVFPDMSRSAIQRAFDAGLVRRDGAVLAKNAKVNAGDELEFSMPEVRPCDLTPAEIPLDVVFEDEHLLAINKMSGMVVHPGAGTDEDTLVHALLAHCRGQLSGIGGVERPGIVHRLDRETSGLILVAKTDEAHRGLAALFAERDLEKEYLALVSGVPELLSGSVRKPIGRHPTHRHKMAVVEGDHRGREAHTDWEVMERYGSFYSLLRCQIHTGRTHQIRVHLSSMRLPILGDSMYGYKTDARLTTPPSRTMLHAFRLNLEHPVTHEPLVLKALPPPDFQQQVDQLRALFPVKRQSS
jgi:23S rRNA pseudouridine1911/1915/1917 synthase